VRLRAVLDHGQTMALGKIQDRRQIGWSTVKVHRHDRACPAGERCTQGCRIERETPGLNIDQHRAGTDQFNRHNGRDGGMADRDDFIPRPNTSGQQRQLQGGRAGVDADRLTGAEVSRELPLEGLDLRSEHVLP